MSAEALRSTVVKRLQDAADTASSMAISQTVRPATQELPATTAEEYAMLAVQALATARAYLTAITVVENEFRRMTQPDRVPDPTKNEIKRLYG